MFFVPMFVGPMFSEFVVTILANYLVSYRMGPYRFLPVNSIHGQTFYYVYSLHCLIFVKFDNVKVYQIWSWWNSFVSNTNLVSIVLQPKMDLLEV